MGNTISRPGPRIPDAELDKAWADKLRAFAEDAKNTGKVSDEGYAEIITRIENFEKDHAIQR